MTIAVESPAIGTLFIYNMKGESVFQKRIFDQMYMVDLETLKPGVYILKVIGSDCEIERKFIKE